MLDFRVALVCTLVPLAALAAAPQKTGFVHTPPPEGKLGEPLPVEGSLQGTATFQKIVIRVRSPGEDYEDYTLELQYGDLYRVVLPGSRMVPPGIEYYIEGIAAGDERVPLFATPSRPVRVTVPGKASASFDKPEKPERPEKPEKDLEKPEKVEKPKTEVKCKKTKRGKKCWEEKVAPAPEKEPEPKDVAKDTKDTETKPVDTKVADATDTSKDTKDSSKDTKKEPVKEPAKEPAKDARKELAKDAKKEPTKDPKKDVKPEKVEPKQAEPPRKRSELEEELAIYTAEEPAGFVQRLDEGSRRTVLAPTIFTAAQLKQLGVRYVYEALDLVPGLSVSRDVQGFWRVAVRGLRSDPEVLFTLDGQPLNDFYDGKALAALPIDNLARIEIYRGPATADVRPGNFLAVVNLVTNREDGLRVAATGGIYQAFDGHLSAAKSFSGLKLFVDADVASQYGERRTVTKDGLDTPSFVRAKSTLDKRLLVNAGGGLSYSNEKAGTISLQGRFMLENRTALIGLFDAVGNDSALSWMVLQGSLGWERPLANGGLVSMKVWFDDQSTDRLWQQAPDGYQVRAGDASTLFPDGILEESKVGVIGLGLDAHAEFVLPAKNRLSTGLTGQFNSLVAYDLLSNLEPGANTYRKDFKKATGVLYPTEDGKGGRGPAADRIGFGLFAFDTWTPNDVVSVQAGLRFDLVQLPSVDASGAWAGKHFTPSFGPRLGVSIAPVNSLVFRANYGRSWRAPTVQELAESLPNSDSNQGRFIGNPRLDGPYLDAVEAGFEYLQGLGDARLRLRGTAFFNHFSNPIAMVDSTGNLMPYTNRPVGVQAIGAEGEARLELAQRSSAWLTTAWVRAEDLGTPLQARLLTDSPQVRVNAGFSLPLGRWLDFDVITRFASERRNDSRSVLELIRRFTLPGYVTVAAQLRTEPLFDRLVISVLGQNVFGFDYADDAVRPDRMNGVPRELYQVFGTARLEL